MPLNPAFTSPSTRKLPLLFGYCQGIGDPVLSTVALDGSQFALMILSEGEIDGPEMLASCSSSAAPSHFIPVPLLSYVNPNNTVWQIFNPGGQLPPTATVHFHSGAYTPIGTSIPTIDPTTGLIPANSSQDVGPTQGYDPWFQQFPTVAPPQSFSGIAYAIWGLPSPSSFIFGKFGAFTISGMAVWRGLRCRIFDAYGNVVSYGFTLNPAWHKVEAILRRKIRPEQPAVGGLTDAEKACFNWESIVELAARNDYVLPNGNPRFIGNYAFAADATLANMMETMCRVDRSFQRIDNGQIVLQGDDARASVFIANAKHLVPGTLKLDKKDVSKAPNVFVPSFRDLDIPAVCKVIRAASYSSLFSGGGGLLAKGWRAFTSDTPSPFADGAFMVYGGCDDPTWDGNYEVSAVSGLRYPDPSTTPDTTYSLMDIPPGTPIGNVTGGYLGSNDARFKPRSPDGVQHRAAQLMKGPQAPGLATQPTKIRVVYDCGNSTFDQTNRLMKCERDRTLGTDGTITPIVSITLNKRFRAGFGLSIYGFTVVLKNAPPVALVAGAMVTISASPNGTVNGYWPIDAVLSTTSFAVVASGILGGGADGGAMITAPSAPWKAPICGTLSLYFESVDANGAQLPLVAKEHNVITLDDWLFPEAPGDYEIGAISIKPPDANGSPGQIDLTLQAYNRNAYTDVSDAPGSYYMSVPNSSLPLAGFTPVPNAAWALNATLAIAADGAHAGKLAITIPDLLVQVQGQPAATAYPAFSVDDVPQDTPVALYVTDPSGIGTAPVFGCAAMPYAPPPGSGTMVVATGSFSL